MTSKIFNCSRQRAMRMTQEVLKEMRLKNEIVDVVGSRILAKRDWRFFSPAKEVEIILYSDDKRVEIAVNVETQIKALDFGSSEYLEEEILFRLRDRLN